MKEENDGSKKKGVGQREKEGGRKKTKVRTMGKTVGDSKKGEQAERELRRNS